jgi:putative DNA primase/helicase
VTDDIDRTAEFLELVAEEQRDELRRNGFEPDDPGPDEPAPPDDDMRADVTAHSGQLGIAKEFERYAAGELLYVHGIGWHYWDDTRWKLDDSGVASRKLHDMLKDKWRLAFAITEKKKRNSRISQITACESNPGIKGVLAIAATLIGFATVAADLDADPYLINCADCTLDLRTMTTYDHDPADRITKITKGAYRQSGSPATVGADWTSFLDKVLPDGEVRDYLQRVSGVALFGKVIEQNLTILKGSGNNGKTRFYQALMFAFGDYASMTDPDLFLERKSSSHLGEMALRGLRLAIVSESGKGRAIDEARMKRLTGGDQINARFHYQNPVTFDPNHLPLFITNHLPKVSGDDPAVWRRLRVVPFDVVITPAERDSQLEEKLQLEADAVLAWAIAGWKTYTASNNNLGEPEGVIAATRRYRSDSDDVGRWFDDNSWVTVNSDLRAPGSLLKSTTKQLHDGYLHWARQEGGDNSISLKAFGDILDAKGFPVTHRTEQGRWRSGICPCDRTSTERDPRDG